LPCESGGEEQRWGHGVFFDFPSPEKFERESVQKEKTRVRGEKKEGKEESKLKDREGLSKPLKLIAFGRIQSAQRNIGEVSPPGDGGVSFSA